MSGTRIKGARIPNEIADFYDDYDMRSLLVGLYEGIRDGYLEVKNGEICVNTPVNTLSESVPNTAESSVNNSVNTLSAEAIETLKDIEGMVEYSGGTLEGFLSDLDAKLTWTDIKLKGGKIDLVETDRNNDLEMELDNLQKACDEKGVSINEAIRKSAQMIWGIRQ